MVPAATDRLRDGGDIVAVLRGRRQRAGRLAVLHVRSQRPSGTARVAVVASRKVGGAVPRNRAKRLLREAARHVTWAEGTDVVLVARGACASASFAEVHREVHHLAQQLGALGDAA